MLRGVGVPAAEKQRKWVNPIHTGVWKTQGCWCWCWCSMPLCGRLRTAPTQPQCGMEVGRKGHLLARKCSIVVNLARVRWALLEHSGYPQMGGWFALWECGSRWCQGCGRPRPPLNGYMEAPAYLLSLLQCYFQLQSPAHCVPNAKERGRGGLH